MNKDQKPAGEGVVLPKITLDQFELIEIKAGLVVEATAVEGSDKLLREVVDFTRGSVRDYRIIFSGLKKWYKPEDLVGKKFLFVTNLEYKKMPSFRMNSFNELEEEYSQGMILAVEGEDPSAGSGQAGKPLLVSAEGMPVGAKVR